MAPGRVTRLPGTVYLGLGWEFNISATDSALFDAGDWFWQAIASKGSEKITIGYGNLKVEAALEYAGTPGAFDGRSQAKKDLRGCTSSNQNIDCWWRSSGIQDWQSQPQALRLA